MMIDMILRIRSGLNLGRSVSVRFIWFKKASRIKLLSAGCELNCSPGPPWIWLKLAVKSRTRSKFKHIITSRPGRDDRHFADDTFKCTSFNEKCWFLLQISLKFVLKDPIKRSIIGPDGRTGDQPFTNDCLFGFDEFYRLSRYNVVHCNTLLYPDQVGHLCFGRYTHTICHRDHTVCAVVSCYGLVLIYLT